MKGFIARHNKILGFLGAVVLGLSAVGGYVFAANAVYQPSGLFTNIVGSITVVAPPVTPDCEYTLSTNTLQLVPVGSLVAGNPAELISQNMTVTNTGNQPISGLTVTIVNQPTGITVTASVQGGAIATGTAANNYGFNVLINFTAPAAGSYNLATLLSGIQLSVTPNP